MHERAGAVPALLRLLVLVGLGSAANAGVGNVSRPGGGCTVPPADNYNESATFDDGSCSCYDGEERRKSDCTPFEITTPLFGGKALCPKERPLTCMLCKPAEKTCIYACDTGDGERCNTLTLNSQYYERLEETSQLQFLGICMMSMILVVTGAYAHHSEASYMQESMVFVMLGICLGLCVLAYAYFVAEDLATAEKLFADNIEFKGNVFFYMLLPPIILDGGYNMKKARFFRNLDRIVVFSMVGTLISTFIIGFMLYAVDFGVLEHDRPWEALQFGAMISATDPVASLSVLSSMGQLTDKDLFSLIFGEAILNDAVAIVLFTVFAEFNHPPPGVTPNLSFAFKKFASVSMGSLFIGVVVGLVTSSVTKKVHHLTSEPHIEISIMFLSAYGSYLIADVIELSGIISLFFCAIVLTHYAKYNLSERSQIITVTGFHTLAFLAEACVYAYVGIDLVLGIKWAKVQFTFVVYVVFACAISRAANIFPCALWLNKHCTKKDRVGNTHMTINTITYKSQFVMWFAGLRGPVAYALAKKWRDETENENFHHIVSTTMILVVLTTFVCGGSFAKIIRVLEMEVTEQEVDPWATESPVTEGDGPVEDPDKTTQAYDMYTGSMTVTLPYKKTGLMKWIKLIDDDMKIAFGGQGVKAAEQKAAQARIELAQGRRRGGVIDQSFGGNGGLDESFGGTGGEVSPPTLAGRERNSSSFAASGGTRQGMGMRDMAGVHTFENPMPAPMRVESVARPRLRVESRVVPRVDGAVRVEAQRAGVQAVTGNRGSVSGVARPRVMATRRSSLVEFDSEDAARMAAAGSQGHQPEFEAADR